MSEEDAVNPAGPVTSTEPTTDAEAVKPETPATSETPEDPAAQPKRKGVGKRIDELVREREEKRREAEYWREEALKVKGQRSETKTDDKEPKEADFNSYTEYLRAVAKYELKQELKAERETQEKKQSETQQKERFSKLAEGFEERSEKLREKYADYDEVVSPLLHDEKVHIPMGMAEAILESEEGPSILYHLGNNPKELSRIARLGSYAAAREIGKLEAKLPELTKPSSAPAPINPVKPKSQASEGPSDSDDMKDWIKKRQKQVHGK